MNLVQHYEHLTTETDRHFDAAQAAAVAQLQQLNAVLTTDPPRDRGLLSRLLPRRAKAPVCAGLYLWGGVGRGKTWLMDIFYQQLPLKQKRRLHFHHFMQEIHTQLAHLRHQRNPLERVAAEFARHSRVLCLDEFYVEDISDAMVLYGLLQALIKHHVTLVLTSNQPPVELYKNGLQRERFLPAIQLINDTMTVFNLEGHTDHRLRNLKKAATYLSPADKASDQTMFHHFQRLSPNAGLPDQPVTIQHRQIPTRYCADDTVWFDFHPLCLGPRASQDYVEIARRFHTVFISGVPVFTEHLDDAAHRFIDLMDELYDHRVNVILSAEDEPEGLYRGRRYTFEFRRTQSRLQEMCSYEYMAEPHRP
jgi:cell division protein ZapE